MLQRTIFSWVELHEAKCRQLQERRRGLSALCIFMNSRSSADIVYTEGPLRSRWEGFLIYTRVKHCKWTFSCSKMIPVEIISNTKCSNHYRLKAGEACIHRKEKQRLRTAIKLMSTGNPTTSSVSYNTVQTAKAVEIWMPRGKYFNNHKQGTASANEIVS